ncbi:ArnT family glycosyltransferase [Parvularcula sp. LCG005]|uniref:ArnT family glycosyltransferase n=1 Tax=Parvularcula sp. LCG005 TaxID=3078805 RepID=UPI0029426D61|nr:glycosyltransferase family 39 protein [Parvularcula sp. LCG005]WOI52725.1 glycosyltransferase family 39 protein [Parvularcula sp. LCG005]
MTLSPFIRARTVLEDRPVEVVLGLVTAVTLLRLILLFFYQTSLGPDEAQYWFWSRDLDFGYYSKPPMIAWSIALPTAIFGDWTWSVRFLSPIFIGGTAMFLFATGRRLYGDGVGVWAALLWLFLPAVMLGATIMSTDIPLLFFWSMALHFLVSLYHDGPFNARRNALGLGVALGLGMLSKYAMIYFAIGWGLSLLIVRDERRGMPLKPGLFAVALAALIFAPNIVWNITHGMQTLNHTADNAHWDGNLLNPGSLLDFVGAQFGVFGPILFGAFLAGIVTLGARLRGAGEKRPADLLLLCFALPPLLIICVQALLSRAHANWAMAAYPAASILVTAWLLRWRARWGLWAATALHVAVGLFFTVLSLNFALADRLGMSNEVKRLRGWDETAAQLRAAAEGFDAIIVDEREIAAHLTWEWRHDDVPLMVFDLNGQPDNTYEYAMGFEAQAGERYLLATQWSSLLCMYAGFAEIEPMGQSFVDLKATRRGRPERTIDLYAVSDYTPLRTPVCPPQ